MDIILRYVDDAKQGSTTKGTKSVGKVLWNAKETL